MGLSEELAHVLRATGPGEVYSGVWCGAISVLGLTARCSVEMDLRLSWRLGAGEEEALGPRCGGPWVWGPAKQKSLCQCLRPHRVAPELSSGHLDYLECRLGR